MSATAMEKNRVEGFSDGVIGVAITLPALDLRVPERRGSQSLAHDPGQMRPNYAAYVVSFLVLGIIWINHHAMLRRLASVDHTFLALNLILLLTIVVLPFSRALIAEYLRVARGQRLAAAIYAGAFLVMSLVFFAMQRHVLISQTHLLRSPASERARRAALRRNAGGLVPYALALCTAPITPYLTLAICGAVAVFHATPGASGALVEDEG